MSQKNELVKGLIFQPHYPLLCSLPLPWPAASIHSLAYALADACLSCISLDIETPLVEMGRIISVSSIFPDQGYYADRSLSQNLEAGIAPSARGPKIPVNQSGMLSLLEKLLCSGTQWTDASTYPSCLQSSICGRPVCPPEEFVFTSSQPAAGSLQPACRFPE